MQHRASCWMRELSGRGAVAVLLRSRMVQGQEPEGHGGLACLSGSAPLGQQVAHEARGWAAGQGGQRRRSLAEAEGQALGGCSSP